MHNAVQLTMDFFFVGSNKEPSIDIIMNKDNFMI